VRVESMLENSSRLARFGVRLYNLIQRHCPWLHHPYYMLIEGMSLLNRSSVSLGGRYYSEVVRNFAPHLVFSVHDCLNRGYFQAARRILGDRVRCATYCSEFSGGYGYSRNWVEPSVDLYISRTRTARDYAVDSLGLDPSRVVVRGQFLTPRIYRETLKPYQRHRFLTERLRLRPDRRVVLLSTGGAGANNHLAILEVLGQYADVYQAVIVCGRNKAAFLEASRWKGRNPDFSCEIVAYTKELHLCMQVADFVITRGGTTTCAEALHFSCPIVFNGFGGVMPQETLTVKYFMQDKAAELVSKPGELQRLLSRWNRSPRLFAGLRSRFLSMRFEDDPAATVRMLVDLAREAASADKLSKAAGE